MKWRAVLGLVVIATVSPALAQPPKAPPTKEAAPAQVVKIRVSQLVLYDPEGKRIGSVSRNDISLPLPILEVNPKGFLKIRLEDGREVWVRPYTVETDKPIKASSDKPAGTSGPKSGGTRDVGPPAGTPGVPKGPSEPVGPPAGTAGKG